MSTSFTARRAAVLGATLLLVAGCGSSTTTGGTSPSPTSTQSSTSRSFQVTTPDGQVSVSLDGKLPPNWPSGFPVPSDAEVAGSGSLGGAGSAGLVAVYRTSSAPQSTFSFYTSSSELTTTGATSVGAGQSFAGSLKVTAPYKGSVTVLAHSGTTYIVIVLTVPRASPST
jgi:hypothetical protein